MLLGKLKRVFGATRKSVIQPATEQDYAVLSEIHKTSFSRGWTDGEFEALLAQDAYSCLVARKSGNIDIPAAGFVLIKSVLDEAEIISVATKPSARRKGIAWQLMSAAIRKLSADRVKSVFLEVDINNEAAIRLYKKLGFETLSSRQGYYSDPDGTDNKTSAALVMQLQLG